LAFRFAHDCRLTPVQPRNMISQYPAFPQRTPLAGSQLGGASRHPSRECDPKLLAAVQHLSWQVVQVPDFPIGAWAMPAVRKKLGNISRLLSSKEKSHDSRRGSNPCCSGKGYAKIRGQPLVSTATPAMASVATVATAATASSATAARPPPSTAAGAATAAAIWTSISSVRGRTIRWTSVSHPH